VNSVVLFDAVGLGLLVLGLHALFFRPHLVHKLVAANVAASGTFLVLVRIPAEGVPDPVAQALVLTGIVVSVAITGFAAALADRLSAALADRLSAARGRNDLDGEGE
jgi:multicomponent Na+:H+ antiporter subunit C